VRSCTRWCECCVCAVSGLRATYAVAVAGAVGLPFAVDAVGAVVIPLTERAKTAAARRRALAVVAGWVLALGVGRAAVPCLGRAN
jgi:hypothetical protein